MDEIDRAQEHEQRDRDGALAAYRARRIAAAFAPVSPIGARDCIDCGAPIEPARLAALRGCTSRCTACAGDYERAAR